MAFSHNKYTESDAVKNARQNAEANSTYTASDSVNKASADLASHEASKPSDWTGGSYGEALQGAIDKISNREKFSYDLNGDALYQQYKNQYMQQGKLAMQDTIGQASAMTGGYGNSYAATAGNQAYQGYLTKLNEVVPELYQMAYDKYNNETEDMYNQANLYNNMYNQEYGEYRDTVSDWQTEANRLSDRYYNEANLDYTKFTDNRDYLNNVYNNERTYDYNLYDDAYNKAFGEYQQKVSEEQFETENEYKENALAQEKELASDSDLITSLKVKISQYETMDDLRSKLDTASTITRGGRGNTGNGGYRYDGVSYKTYDEAYNAAEQDIADAYNNGSLTDAQADTLLKLLESKLIK